MKNKISLYNVVLKFWPYLTLINKEKNSVCSHRAVGKENRIVLDVWATKVEQPEKGAFLIGYVNYENINCYKETTFLQ